MLDPALSRFLVAGGATVGVDAVVYTALQTAGMAIDPAKAIGFIAGTVFAYFVNRSWTFRSSRRGLGLFSAFALLYASSLAINTGANRGVLEIAGETPAMLAVAWFVATCLSASWNFAGMRWIVFK